MIFLKDLKYFVIKFIKCKVILKILIRYDVLCIVKFKCSCLLDWYFELFIFVCLILY